VQATPSSSVTAPAPESSHYGGVYHIPKGAGKVPPRRQYKTHASRGPYASCFVGVCIYWGVMCLPPASCVALHRQIVPAFPRCCCISHFPTCSMMHFSDLHRTLMSHTSRNLITIYRTDHTNLNHTDSVRLGWCTSSDDE